MGYETLTRLIFFFALLENGVFVKNNIVFIKDVTFGKEMWKDVSLWWPDRS